jgi:HEAT repeat protein
MVMPKRFAKLLHFLTPKRQWAQFSLGTMLLAVTVLCVWLADYVSPIRRLQRQLRDPDEDVRELAAERLGYLGSEARSTTNSLLHATADTSSLVRLKAVWALSRVSGRADLLVPLLADDDAEVRLAAAEGLLSTGYEPRKVVSTLLELCLNGLTDQEVDSIFEALGPRQSALVVPLLVDSLWSAEEVERRDEGNPAASALRNVAVPAPTVVPALVDRLISTRPEVRTAAAEQLLRLAKAAKEALPVVRLGMHDSNPACAAACAAAVGAIDPDDPDFLRVLTKSLTSDDVELPHHAAAYLFMLGPAAAEAADNLAARLCGRDPTLLWAGDGNILR